MLNMTDEMQALITQLSESSDNDTKVFVNLTPEVGAPLFPGFHVQLTGGDGNVYFVTGRLTKSLKSYLKASGCDRKLIVQLEESIWEQLKGQDSYDDALLMLQQIGHVS